MKKELKYDIISKVDSLSRRVFKLEQALSTPDLTDCICEGKIKGGKHTKTLCVGDGQIMGITGSFKPDVSQNYEKITTEGKGIDPKTRKELEKFWKGDCSPDVRKECPHGCKDCPACDYPDCKPLKEKEDMCSCHIGGDFKPGFSHANACKKDRNKPLTSFQSKEKELTTEDKAGVYDVLKEFAKE